jgi:hypothetical protein
MTTKCSRLQILARLGVLAAIAGAAGCFPWRKSAEDVSGLGAAVQLDQDGRPVGAHAEAMGGEGGFAATFELVGQRVQRANDEDTHYALGAGFGARFSPLALLADDHRLERYFDFGAEAGVNGSIVKAPPNVFAARGEAYYGGYVELGTVRASDGYLALTGNLRVIDASEPWNDLPVQVSIGVAWRKRSKPTPGRWRD